MSTFHRILLETEKISKLCTLNSKTLLLCGNFDWFECLSKFLFKLSIHLKYFRIQYFRNNSFLKVDFLFPIFSDFNDVQSSATSIKRVKSDIVPKRVWNGQCFSQQEWMF